MATAPNNPTNLTPPRVALIDERTGAISREWYRFFLSLLTATQSNDQTNNSSPDSNSLLASLQQQLDDVFNVTAVLPPPTGGTVTSVAASGGSTGLTFSGSPIITSGTLTLGGTLAVANGGTGATTAAGARANLGAAKSGANSDITSMSGITGAIGTPTYIQFDSGAGTTLAAGRLWYDQITGSLNMGMGGGNITQQIGEEIFVYGKASAAITEGQVVVKTGAVGASGTITFAPAPLGTTDTQAIIGVATENIPLNGFGRITSFGVVHGINTTGAPYGETWADGDTLYYNPNYVGGLTKVKPSAPNQKTEVGIVINAGSGGSGSIQVEIIHGTVLGGTDSNVQLTSPTNNDLLQYYAAGPYWRNLAPSSVSVGTATNLAGGAANRIAYQTGAGATGFIAAPTVANTFLEWSGSVFQWSSNPLGTVTSVNVSGGTTGLSFSGGPITTSGTITMAGTLGVPNGGTGANTLTAGYLVKGNGTSAVSASIIYDDGTNVGVGGTPAYKLDVFGDVRVSSGGDLRISSATGTTGASGDTVFYSDVNDLNIVVNGVLRYKVGSAGQFGIGGATYGTSGQVLTSQGSASPPIWATPTTGTVTSVSGTGSVNGITLSGTVTSSGSLTLGGTLSGVSLTSQVTGTLPIANGGTGATDAATARANLGAGTGNGTVTSVSGTGSVNGITLTGTVSSSGSLTLGGTLSGVSLTSQVSGTLPVGNGGTGATTLSSGYLVKGNGTSAVSASVAYDNGTQILIGTTTGTAASVVGLLQVESEVFSKGSSSGFFFENRSGGVTSGSNWYGWYNTGGTTYFYNPAVGNIASINSATGAYTALSDENKKTDFEPSTVGLNAVLALQPKLFRMKTDADGAPKQLGFVAQEVKNHIPQAYVEEQNIDAAGNDTTYIGLNDRPLIAALVKAVQELSARLDALENAG